MGSGIVSIDLYSDHQPVLSAIMLWFAAGAWLLLVVVLGARLVYQRDRLVREARSPASFTGVAGTAELGTRLAMQGYHVAAAALLAVSGVGWVLLPRLTYDVRRWATVFPLGMYAACSFAAGQVTGISGIADFGHVWTWVAFTVSLFVLAGLFRHGWPVLRGQHRPAAAEDGA